MATKMSRVTIFVFFFIILQCVILGCSVEIIDPMESMVAAMEEEGYYRREHSMVQPYQGNCRQLLVYL